MEQTLDLPLGYLLKQASMALHTRILVQLKPLGLTLPQYVCLQMLHLQPDTSNAELARFAFVSRQAMNAVLRELEETGLVSRPESASSGRALPARLTQQGAVALQQAIEGIQTAEEQILTSLNTEERMQLNSLLARSIENCSPTAIQLRDLMQRANVEQTLSAEPPAAPQ